MIVHSNDGVFAIRKGPWKWIEGVPANGISAGARKGHAQEFQRRLYNLQDDPKETTDVSEQHPEVVKDLEAMLHRQRDEGHTRELPRNTTACNTPMKPLILPRQAYRPAALCLLLSGSPQMRAQRTR